MADVYCRMGRVVVDPDEKASDTLCQQLAHLNLDSLPAVNEKIAQELCDHALPELMICSRMDWARNLARANRRLPVVLATPDELDREALLSLTLDDVPDEWEEIAAVKLIPTATPSPTNTPTITPTPTETPTVTPSPTETPTITPTPDGG